MNLLHDSWMPVRNAQGQRAWITPDRLAEPQWLAFDADRPDFNGALAQFAIGLLQTTTPVTNSIEWRGLFNAPPDAAALRRWFEPVAAAFELDGDGPRFMQDLALASEPGKTSPISEILIDAPGESTLDGNKDHFNKRGTVQHVCVACAATALLALQLNAPEGGRGHFTGLRGGGPLTTLVRRSGSSNLWCDTWMNVIEPSAQVDAFGPDNCLLGQSVFPWLDTVNRLQPAGGSITSAQVSVHHMFWAMPRRVRLTINATAHDEVCSICSRPTQQAISTFSSRPNGFNYPSQTWNHTLTPYRNKDGAWLPVRPKPDGLGYRHWQSWVQGAGVAGTRRAICVDRALTGRNRQLGGGLCLWTFGYEMRKDNPVAWHESTMPLYGLAACDQDRQRHVQAEITLWIAAAELASSYLRGAVKAAWFSRDARGDFGHVDAAFWSATGLPFYRQLQALIDAACTGADHPDLPTREAWHATLVREALRLFDHSFVGSGAVERQNPRRAALAYKQLRKNLYGPKMRQALGLPTDESQAKPTRKTARRKPQEAA